MTTDNVESELPRLILEEPRVRESCSTCGKIVYALRMDKGRHEGSGSDHVRYLKVGYWCEECGMFYYLDGAAGPRIVYGKQ